jgi:iron(III) transport system substrate-binding protein
MQVSGTSRAARCRWACHSRASGSISRGALALTGAWLILAAACAPAPAAPTGEPAQAARSGSATAPASSGAAAPAGQPAGWDQTVAAAKQDGKLALSGPPGSLWRDALLTFEKDYPEIKVEFTGMNSRDFWPRLVQERQSNQFLWDLRVGGPDPQVYQARDEGMLAPIRPLLALPEVADDSKWLGGLDGLFVDNSHEYLPGFTAYVRTSIWVNRDAVPESELNTQRGLLESRSKGKIVVQDPRGGAGLGVLTVMLAGNGEQYVRDLLTNQEVTVTGDNRQQAEWVVRGRYPIGVGMGTDQLIVFEQQGLKFNVKPLEEGPKGLNIGFGGLQLMDRAPHPNATKLFINWLLTQRVQEHLSKTIETNSRRLDVAPFNPAEQPDPARMSEYVPHQAEALLPQRQRTQQLASELIK